MAPINLSDVTESPRCNHGDSQITISEYIFHRILQTGAHSVFGVPGDFNLALLEHIYDVPELNWIGCCNELNAAYAADGYAKVSKQMSALITTYGVGELSALNGIAGAFSEFAPVLHIVGTSRMSDKRSPAADNIHHLVPSDKVYMKPDHYVYEGIARKFSCVTASIEEHPLKACNLVDNAIETIFRESRPGYLFLPCDLAEMKVPTSRLMSTPLNLGFPMNNNPALVEKVVQTILHAIYTSQNVSLVADSFINKCRLNDAFHRLLSRFGGKINLFDTYVGKGILDEHSERYIGTVPSIPAVKEAVESSDLVLHVGSFTTELCDPSLPVEVTIELNSQYVRIGKALYTDVTLMDVLPALAGMLDTSRINEAPRLRVERATLERTTEASLTESDLFNFLEASLQPNDVLVVETCSFLLAAPKLHTNGARILGQSFYGSIGYALPATMGASLALRDFQLPGRVITVEGDGSAEMSLQELCSMIRYRINANFLLLNNSGYTIERAIKGPTSSYNDICSNIRWSQLLKVFGDPTEKVSDSTTITTKAELDATSMSKNGLHMLELRLDKFDMPPGLDCVR